MADRYPKIILKPGREKALKARHPWIFSGAIKRPETDLTDGDIVEVTSATGRFLAIGHFSPRTIAVKVFSFRPIEDERRFWREAVAAAAKLRAELGLIDNRETTAFRLIHGEGDGLPGLVVDIYNRTAVLQCHSAGMFRWRGTIAAALQDVLAERLESIFVKHAAAGEAEGAGAYLIGGPQNPVIKEHGLNFVCDWERGQKTGFYIDQRENRRLFESYARGRRVLNAFCYTGAFSAYAARGGAAEIVSIDASKAAVDQAAQNLDLNGAAPPHREMAADCFDFLKRCEDRFDLIALDPPAFVKHQKAYARGLRGYESLNFEALRRLAPGGVLFTFSCSELVSRADFRRAVSAAAARARRPVRVLHELSQAPCHPINIFHPEGGYLKGLVCRAD